MLQYVIGMDGGGTKTEVLVADREKKPLLRFQGGAINYNGQSKASVDANLQEIFRKILREGYAQTNCTGICIGAAGTSNPAVRTQIMENVREFGYECSVSVLGDEETAFAGALEGTSGAILIAGTGSICYGRDLEGNTYRSGGFGHIIDDAGSGYAIARDMLTAVVRAQDGRGEPTVLADMVFSYLNIGTIEELVGYLYHPGRSKKEIAQLSILIKAAYDAEDPAAIRIVKNCAAELAELASPVLKRIGEGTKLAVSGSILLKNEDIYREFISRMKELFIRTEVIRPRQDAAYGAVLLALQLIA